MIMSSSSIHPDPSGVSTRDTGRMLPPSPPPTLTSSPSSYILSFLLHPLPPLTSSPSSPLFPPPLLHSFGYVRHFTGICLFQFGFFRFPVRVAKGGLFRCVRLSTYVGFHKELILRGVLQEDIVVLETLRFIGALREMCEIIDGSSWRPFASSWRT